MFNTFGVSCGSTTSTWRPGAAKAADVVGLYIDPPAKAIVARAQGVASSRPRREAPPFCVIKFKQTK